MSTRVSFGLYGALFGLAFPLAALLTIITTQNLEWSLGSVAQAHYTQPLMWIIDSAPLFLGGVAWIAGGRQEKYLDLVGSLTEAAQQTREERDDFFRVAVEAAPSGLVMVDSSGKIVMINEQTVHLFGYATDEIVGQPVEMLLPQSIREYHPTLIESFFKNPTRRAMGTGRDLHAQRKDGTLFPVEIGLNPIERKDGWFALAALVDVSERKMVEEAILASKKAAEDANRLKSEFLANMSHELRTPLNSIIGFSNLLLKNKRGHLDKKDISFGERINDNGLHLLGLINEILDLSKVEAGKLEFTISPTNVESLVRTTLEELQSQAEMRNLKLICEIPPELAEISADQIRLKQVLINIVGNALKFTDEGSVKVRVSQRKGSRLPQAIEVADTGIGIPQEKQSTVFEPFQQADASTSRTHGGTGLGLAISKRLCQAMGFELSMTSEVGKGTTFYISLAGARKAESERFLLEDILPSEPLSESSPMVLVIDDDDDARVLATHAFHSIGWRVVTASSGAQGLAMALELGPNLISLDLLMPEMSGWELIRQIREHPQLRATPAIVVSSVADTARFSIVRDIDILSKPIDTAHLEKLLGRYSAKSSDDVIKILIVDDDSDARALLREQVTPLGAKVWEASDGREGLEILEQQGPDVVLLDLMMPHVDGFEFLSRLKQMDDRKDTPVIVVSAKELTADERRYLASTTEAVHEKGPWLQEELLRSMAQFGFALEPTKIKSPPS